MDLYSFYTGKMFNAYEELGCRISDTGARFLTFAPNAQKISVIGDFNDWQENPMKKIYDGNFWELKIRNAKVGMRYKYRIYGADGRCIDHCDPYGYGMELRPDNASIIRDMKAYKFNDKKWLQKRTNCKNKPLNIYELHFGSWRNNPDDENGWYNYSQLADILIPYLIEYGYNYIEIMPICEYPCDASWGYQVTGFYSPTSRYGTCDDLKCFIDKCHQNNIGVILDFVPVHFAVDDYALANYDGSALYEYPHNDVGYNEWGSRNFNHSRGEVQSFLQSCANYWISEYHFDGLRMDAISRLIYWQGKEDRGVNQNTLEFIKRMNGGLKAINPSIILAAEDSTAYPNITKSIEKGGLGFDYKWDMGFMNDTLSYFQAAPYFRGQDYHKLTFSMMYFYNENYLLPFSHDETVHGKATIIQKMNGQYEVKFPQAKALYMYMYAHPGKKLNFMGNEIAQFREWDETREQDWDILKYPNHDSFHKFIKELNQIYLKYSAFSKYDYESKGFEWIECHLENRCVYAFERRSDNQRIIAVFNFSGIEQKDFTLNLNDCSKIKLLLASDDEKYGGNKKYKRHDTIIIKNNAFKPTLSAFSAYLYIVANS